MSIRRCRSLPACFCGRLKGKSCELPWTIDASFWFEPERWKGCSRTAYDLGAPRANGGFVGERTFWLQDLLPKKGGPAGTKGDRSQPLVRSGACEITMDCRLEKRG
ncbi:hypothetical protein BSKO_07219 [Bryopsis sp. KO-2023]|nr:hypothetical protein BSKO_07219 [Bryopsis sp. KO-2023]